MRRTSALLLALPLLAGVAGGCGRDPQALALLRISGDLEYTNVTVAVEARAWSVYRGLTNTTIPAQSTGSWLQVGLYLPAAAHGAVGIDVTASETAVAGACVVGVGYTTVDVPSGQASTPTPLLVTQVSRSCNYDAGVDDGKRASSDGAPAADPDAGDAGGDL